MAERSIFAYAYNLSEVHLAEHGIEPVSREVAMLPNRTVGFDAVSIWYPGRASATLHNRRGSHVEGLVYGLTEEVAQLMDDLEYGYHKNQETVYTKNGTEKVVDVYIADKEFLYRNSDRIPLASQYAARVLASGRGIWTPKYLSTMRRKINRKGVNASV